MPLHLSVVEGAYAICRLDPAHPVPPWATESPWYAVTRTDEELSVVCESEHVPADVKQVAGWRLLKVEGPLDFGLTGIIAQLATALANGGVSLFAVSTFDTDYLLVKSENLSRAKQLLSEAGCVLRS